MIRLAVIVAVLAALVAVPIFSEKPMPGDTLSEQMGDFSSTFAYSKENQAYIIFKRRGARLLKRWGEKLRQLWDEISENHSRTSRPPVIQVPKIGG